MLPVDLIDADRANAGEIHVITPPGDGHRDRPEHLVPAGAKDARDLLPTEALGPRREKPLIRRGELVLAIGPRHLFDGDPTAGAGDAPHHVEEEHAQAPERHEFEPARGQAVVDAAPHSAPGALRTIAPMRRDLDRQREADDLLLKLDRPVHKAAVLLNPIQDSLDLHPVVRLREVAGVKHRHSLRSTRDASAIAVPVRVEAAGAVDAQHAPTAPCKTTERFCTSFHTPHHPLPVRRNEGDQNLSESLVTDPQILRRRRNSDLTAPEHESENREA